MATKKFSPAQIAAQKLFAERARAGTLGKTVKRNPVKKNPVEGKSIFNLGGGYFGSGSMSGYNEYYAQVFYRTTDASGSTDDQIVPDYKPRYFVSAKSAVNSLMRYKTKNLGRKTNPDKSKPRAYVKRATKPKYSAAAVNKAIASSRSKISASEGKTIHRLLKGRHGNPAAKKPLTLQERSKKFKIELGFDKFKTFKKVVGYYPSDSSPDYELVALFQTQREAVSAGRTYAENYPKFRWFVKDL